MVLFHLKTGNQKVVICFKVDLKIYIISKASTLKVTSARTMLAKFSNDKPSIDSFNITPKQIKPVKQLSILG